MGQISSIAIEELTGQKRKLELIGAGLPLRGAKFASTVVMATTWNPGNGADATQHILCPTDAPSNWSGKWNTTRLVASPALFYQTASTKTGQPIVRAASLVQAFELIQRAGQRLRVTWFMGTEDGDKKLVYEGICQNFELEWERGDDVNWSMTWEWAGRGPALNRALNLQSDLTMGSLKSAHQMLTDYTSSVTADEIVNKGAVPFAADSFTLGQLEAIANAPREWARQLQRLVTSAITRMQDIFDIVGAVATTPQALAGTALNIATETTEAVAQELDEMGRLYPDAASEVDGDVAALITAAAYFEGQQASAEGIAGAMAQIREEARRRSSQARATAREAVGPGDLLAVIIARQGQTFVSLAKAYYRNPDLAGVLATSNGFADYEVAPPPGTTLIIPALKASDQQALYG